MKEETIRILLIAFLVASLVINAATIGSYLKQETNTLTASNMYIINKNIMCDLNGDGCMSIVEPKVPEGTLMLSSNKAWIK
jgi:hypothetical protein